MQPCPGQNTAPRVVTLCRSSCGFGAERRDLRAEHAQSNAHRGQPGWLVVKDRTRVVPCRSTSPPGSFFFESFREGAWGRCCRCRQVGRRSPFTSAWSGMSIKRRRREDEISCIVLLQFLQALLPHQYSGANVDDLAWKTKLPTAWI